MPRGRRRWPTPATMVIALFIVIGLIAVYNLMSKITQ
jgi:hypothetical protein